MRRNGWRTICTALTMLAAIVWLPSSTAAAEKPEMIVSLERSKIYVGESVLYEVMLNHIENPRDPDMKALETDFQVASLGSTSMNSQEVRIINGQMTKTVRLGRQYNYRLTPKRTGLLTVPSPTANVDGQPLRGRDLTLDVRPPEEQDVARMQIRADRNVVYPMQPFTIVLSVEIKALPKPFDDKNPVTVQSSPPTLTIPWAIDEQLPDGIQPKTDWRQWLGAMEGTRGFNVNNLAREPAFSLMNRQAAAFMPDFEKVSLPDKLGKPATYWRYEFRREFIPKKIGKYSFGPASLKGMFVTDVVDGRATGETVYAVAQPLEIDVQDVPRDGRPDCYIGAVGVFQLSAQLEPKRVKTGDPMTLTLTLEGTGTLDTATPPELSKIPAIAEHFKIYDATEQTKGNRRQFTYSLRPLDTEIKEFPAVQAATFDVDAKKYVILHTEPIPIEVSKAVRLASRDIVASNGGLSGNSKEIETSREGIFANITDLNQLGNDSIRPEYWLGGLGGLAVGYMALAFCVGRWRRFSGDTALLRRRAALGVARRRLRQASSAFAAKRTGEGADHVLAAATGFVADMLGLPAGGTTSTEACRQLEAAGVPSELIARLRTLLDACEGVRYGAAGNVSDSLGRDADKLLRSLAASLRKKKFPVVHSAILMAVVLFGGCNHSPDIELTRKFQAAQQAFDDARKPDEFAKVAALDQEILDRWGTSGAVLYNQGNAWMKAEQPGRAVASYRLAQRYLPRDPYLEANLRLALGSDVAPASRPVLETILFWQNWLSYPAKFYLAGAVALATFVVAAGSLFAMRRLLRRVVWVGLALTGVLIFSAAYDWQRFDNTKHGVVIQSQTTARKGNGPNYQCAFKEPLHEATEFRLIERRGDWLLIRLPGGGEGWIEEKAAVTY